MIDKTFILNKILLLHPAFFREELLCRQIGKKQLINKKYKRIYHYHIRKCGGTSINQSFFSQIGNRRQIYKQLNAKINHRIVINNKIIVGWNKNLINQGNYFYAFSHLPMHELDIKSDTFTFTCLRDPVRRIISHYKMLKYWIDNDIKHPSLKKESRYAQKGITEFIQDLPKQYLLNQLYMFSKTYNINEAVENIRNLSHFFFLEDFDKGLEILSKKIGIPIQSLHIRKAKVQDIINIDYDDEVFDKLKLEIAMYNLFWKEYNSV